MNLKQQQRFLHVRATLQTIAKNKLSPVEFYEKVMV